MTLLKFRWSPVGHPHTFIYPPPEGLLCQLLGWVPSLRHPTVSLGPPSSLLSPLHSGSPRVSFTVKRVLPALGTSLFLRGSPLTAPSLPCQEDCKIQGLSLLWHCPFPFDIHLGQSFPLSSFFRVTCIQVVTCGASPHLENSHTALSNSVTVPLALRAEASRFRE